MRKLAEFLAGCPREDSATGEPAPWGSLRAFPGFMMRRMYPLLTRPRDAVREFGAGDLQTPFLFFLFFTIILVLLQSIARELQLAILMQDLLASSGQPAGLDTVIRMTTTISSFIQGMLTSIILAILLLGISLIIISTGLWLLTGVISWNPAFTISAYSLPVPVLLYTILAWIQVPRLFDPLSGIFGLACAAVSVVFMAVIAGYGISALAKTPLVTSGILALFWAIVAILLIWFAPVLVIIPAEDLLSTSVLQAFSR